MNSTNSDNSTLLRVVSVSNGPDGPSISLAGTLETVADLVKAIVASSDLLTVMTPGQVGNRLC